MLGSRSARIALAAMLAVLVLLPGMALGDNLDADGDGVAPVANTNLSFGPVCVGIASTKTVAIAIRRNGNAGSTNVYKDGSSVTITGATGSAGLSITNPSLTIDLPTDWGTQANNTMSSSVPASVTLTASATGAYNGNISWTGTGVRSDDTALTRDDPMTVSATASNCGDTTPPNTTIVTSPAANTASTSASFTYSSTESGSTFECKLDAGSFASCPAAGKSYSGLGDGSHTFQVRATDAANNTDASPASYTWSIDSTAPDTTIETAPSATTAATSAAFTYSSTESGSTFECKLDAGSFASCPAAGKSYSDLGEGSHTFEVRATDSLGNVDATPDSHTWTIDLTAPDTTIVTGPPALTNSTSAAFTYSSTESGSTFECKLDAGDFASCPAAGKSYSGLGEGSHTFAVKATDAVGNADASAATYTWNIDLTPPAVSMPDLTDASDTGVSQIDNFTKDATPSFTGTAEDGATVELLRDDVVVDSTSATGGAWAFTSETLAEGTYSFTARATDAAGNQATSTLLSVVVDLTNPTITEASRLPAANTYGWNNSAVTVTWDCEDAFSGVVDATDSDTVSAEGAGQSASGSCSDVAGNTAGASHGDINIDTTAPNASASATSNGAPYTAGTWTKYDVVVTFGCTDALSDVASVTDPATLGEGENQSASGTCYDKAGNSAGASFSNIDVDKTAPEASASAKTADDAAYTGGTWTNQSVTVTFDCTDVLSGVASLTPASTTLSLEGADQSASSTCTDNAGNTDSASFGDVDIDKTAPEASASAKTADDAAYIGGTWTNQDVTVTFDCTDGLSGVGSLTPASTLLDSEGADQSASATCTDNAGNTDSASFGDVDIDKTAPEASASAKTADDAAYTGGTWTNQSVTVTFDCADALSGVASLTPASTTLSASLANQSASATCIDNAGNSDSASFVDVDIDKVAPGIAFVSRIPAANGNGWNNSAVTVTWSCSDALSGPTTATVSDTVSGEGADQTASGTCYDNAGNSAGATVSNIDVDLTDPYGISWTGGPADGASYYFGSVPGAPTCSAFDDLSLLASCNVTGHGTGIGSHTMTATAVDFAGNDVTATRSYTVLAWNLRGFYSPVDMTPPGGTPVWNTVKGGSTVPLKWEMFNDVEITDPAAISSITATPVTCSGGTADDIEVTSTGGTTSPRYDWTAGQFIYNWQTPKKPGACYRLTMAAGGTSISALFKLK